MIENGTAGVANDMIKVPKGWRLMRNGEITKRGIDMCMFGTDGHTNIEHWEVVNGISDRIVLDDGYEPESNYTCIRLDDKPAPKKKRVPKKQWLNPWD